MTGPRSAARVLFASLEGWLVTLVACHTFAVGFGLFFVPAWALRVGGWTEVPPLFFPRQAGVFHFILGAAYLADFVRHRGVSLLVGAKGCATAFLLAAAALGPVPWFVPLAGVADGMMALAVLAVRRWAPAPPQG